VLRSWKTYRGKPFVHSQKYHGDWTGGMTQWYSVCLVEQETLSSVSSNPSPQKKKKYHVGIMTNNT
jgi:hypothetical protein